MRRGRVRGAARPIPLEGTPAAARHHRGRVRFFPWHSSDTGTTCTSSEYSSSSAESGCSVSDAADDPVRRLTLRQQLGQMLMVRFEGAQPKVWDGAFR